MTEADAIDFAMTNIFIPVNSVISYIHDDSISCESESVHSTTYRMPNNITVNHISRVDKSWRFKNGPKYAILEFKLPGAIKEGEWFPPGGGPVIGGARRMSQQLVKYCCIYGTRCAALCDVENLIVFYLQGNPQDWIRSTPGAAPSVKVLMRWHKDLTDMKRGWFIFNEGARLLKLGHPT